MDKVKFGIIGLGNQGKHYFEDLFCAGKIKNGHITALCDIDGNKLKQVENRANELNVALFTDYKEMLKSGLIDAVLIEVPHYLHPLMVIDCLNSGIHVICEKPAGVYTAQVRKMNEVAKRSKALFSVMFNQRTNCVYRKMREIILSGGIGSLQRVNWIITDWFRPEFYYKSGAWRATWAGEGGGVLINQCPHQLDLIQWIVGEMPESVRGFCKYGKWHDIEVEDEVTAYFEYKSGATGVFITTTGETPGTNRFEVSGTNGKLLCENNKLYWYKNAESSIDFSKTTNESFSRPACEKIEVQTDGKNLQHQEIINNFADAVSGKAKLFVDGTEGVYGVELMNAIELSGFKGGEKITLPVNEEEYIAELKNKCKNSRCDGDYAFDFGDLK